RQFISTCVGHCEEDDEEDMMKMRIKRINFYKGTPNDDKSTDGIHFYDYRTGRTMKMKDLHLDAAYSSSLHFPVEAFHLLRIQYTTMVHGLSPEAVVTMDLIRPDDVDSDDKGYHCCISILNK